MLDKRSIINAIKQLIDTKTASLQERFDDLNTDLTSDHKSSAGDKHETGRAMTQLEQEKLSSQLMQFAIQKETISKLEQPIRSTVQLGSLIKTERGIFFMSIGLGKITISGEDIFCISTSSPIGKLLLNLKVGDSYSFNNISNKIIEII